MNAIRRKSVLGLALLLAAATAAADTVITAEEVIPCSVVSADTNFVRLKLPQGGIRMLLTRAISELRLSDSGLMAELRTRLPDVKVAWYADKLDTLAASASQAQLVARCGDVEAALLNCSWADDSIVGLLREVRGVEKALRGIRPEVATYLVSAPCGGLLGAAIGALIGAALKPPDFAGDRVFWDLGGGPYVTAAGCAAGSALGVSVGRRLRVQALARRHRSRVNEMVRRVNRAVAEP